MANSGDPLNTGDNGFPIDGQKYTYDTGVPDAEGGSQGQFTPGVDVSKSFVDGSGKPRDLSQATKTTLAQYLSRVTLGKEGSTSVPNRYPIDNAATSTSTTDENGNPAQLEQPGNNPTSFVTSPDPRLEYHTQEYPSIAPLIKKGKSSGVGTDGNDLLAGVSGNSTYVSSPNSLAGTSTSPSPVPGHPDTTSLVNSYTSAVLKANRFTSAASAYASVDASDPGNGFDPSFAVQSSLGSHDPQAPTVSAGRMASVATLLALRATTTIGATTPGADPNSAGLQASSLVPGPAQLGAAQVDQQLLLAKDVLASLTSDEVPDADVISIGDKSWGQLNNPNDPFSGTDALGMLTLSLALVAGLTVVIDSLNAVVGAITPQLKQPTHDANGRYALGQYYANEKTGAKAASSGFSGTATALSKLSFGALLGLQPTNFPFNAALQAGFNAFFGLPQGTALTAQLAGTVTSSADSPGFNVVIARSIIRSSTSVVQALSRIGGNPMNAISSVLSMVDTIRSSKAIAALNVWATLGDAILSMPNSWTDSSTTGGARVSAMDAAPDAAGGTIAKSRMRNSLKLAWASNRAPANMLLPASVFAASQAIKGLGQFNTFIGVQEDPSSRVRSTVTQASDNGRISPQDAQEYEKALDAEYVPFYFHDLRTNEMVSFHAFLAALSDDYAAGYEKTEGFGRVEPVKVYKSTERRISMSFYVAATSLPDFDEMWVKLNKLVTLLYPQYTAGQQLSSPDGKSYVFSQPFSQLVGASPLIRIRLGNLLHTNYSRFALARLFGLGNSNFTLNGNQLQGAEALDASTLSAISSKLQTALSDPQDETYYVAHGVFPFFDNSGPGLGGLGVSLPSPSTPGVAAGVGGPQFAPTLDTAGLRTDFYVAKAVRINPNNPQELICIIQPNNDPGFMKAHSSEIAAIDQVYNNPSEPTRLIVGGTYSIPVNALKPTPQNYTRAAASIGALQGIVSQNSTFAGELQDFMDPNKNAVVKSFADTSGRGLAGFIETLGFDWYDKATWETTSDRVAPKMCKVTLTFSPVHDISPGIDSHGFNRAPVYPVGVMAQQR